MVQCMESWFLADRDALKEFYGQGYRQNALHKILRSNKSPNGMFWLDLTGLPERPQNAAYHKGSHSFEILAKLDPEKVKNASCYAKRFVDTLLKLAQN